MLLVPVTSVQCRQHSMTTCSFNPVAIDSLLFSAQWHQAPLAECSRLLLYWLVLYAVHQYMSVQYYRAELWPKTPIISVPLYAIHYWYIQYVYAFICNRLSIYPVCLPLYAIDYQYIYIEVHDYLQYVYAFKCHTLSIYPVCLCLYIAYRVIEILDISIVYGI